MDLLNTSSRVATAALVGLGLLDVVLVGAALRPTDITGVGKSPVLSASVPTPSMSAPARPSAKAPVGATALAAPLQTMLVAIDDQRAWRVDAGSCDAGGATLATTADGGKTWAEGTTLPDRIVRVQPSDGRAAFVVGTDTRCKAELTSTQDGGATWGSAGTVASVWFRGPKDPLVVGAPGSSTSRPCGKRFVLDLAVLSTDSAKVLCVDGVVRQTSDTGSSWTDSGKVPGAVALAVAPANPAQTYVARVGVPRCAGVQILRVGQRVATSCASTTMPKEPGQIALSLVKGGGWLAVGKTTMRSTDDLVTWSAS